MLRFKAAARLGRMLIDRGDLNEGIEWLERAAGSAGSNARGRLRSPLRALRARSRRRASRRAALAILMELDAESDGYRDVRTRITYSRASETESPRS